MPVYGKILAFFGIMVLLPVTKVVILKCLVPSVRHSKCINVDVRTL